MNSQKEWVNLLIDKTIARNYDILFSDQKRTSIERANSIFVSGLLIRAISILDGSIDEFISSTDIEYDTSIRFPKLTHRLKLLESKGLLLDYSEIDKWRRRRNEVGHEVGQIYTWEELEDCLKSIYNELNNLGILSENPTLEFEKTIQRVAPTKKGVTIEQDITINIKDQAKSYYVLKWKLQV